VVFEITILGSNSASFAFNRHHTAQVVNVNQNLYLIDCGEGTQMRLAKFKIKHNRINHIFISHLHGDHYLGLIGLMLTMHLQGREQDLYIFGPKGLDEILTLHLKHSETELNYAVHFETLNMNERQVLIDTEELEIASFPVEHRLPCAGFVFEEKPKKRKLLREKLSGNLSSAQLKALKEGEDVIDHDGTIYAATDVTLEPKKSRKYAYCADTRYTEAILPYINEADIIYHEATFLEDMRDRAIQTYHSTAAQAGTLALKARVGMLLIGHFSSRYRELDSTLEEAKSIFQNTELAIEGKVFSISE
jgi:ribonuclease Z